MKNLSKYVVLIRGGIGNQLFQYAYAKYLQSVENKNVSCYYHLPGDPYNRENIISEIDKSIHLADDIVGRLIVRVITRPHGSINKKMKECANAFGFHFPIKYQEELNYTHYIKGLDVRGLAILEGYWQSAEIVNAVKDELLKHIKCDELSIYYQDIVDKIGNNPESVAVHIRKSWHKGQGVDMTSKEYDHNQQALSKDYYIKAIRDIQAKTKQALFFIFADDTDEISNLIGDILPKEQFIVVPNHNNFIADYQALILMSQCKNFIMSNSTFGWWGAWLSWAKQQSQQKHAIYCMPNQWDKNDEYGWIAQSFKFSPQCVLLDD